MTRVPALDLPPGSVSWSAPGLLRRRPVLAALASILAIGIATGPLVAGAALTGASPPTPVHRIVILIDSDDETVMGHAISYSVNLSRSYAARKERVTIEVVANGLGIKLLRADTSPFRQPLAAVHQALPDIVFSMCESSRHIAEVREGHAIPLVPEARLVPFGIGRVADLEEAGWAYIHG